MREERRKGRKEREGGNERKEGGNEGRMREGRRERRKERYNFLIGRRIIGVFERNKVGDSLNGGDIASFRERAILNHFFNHFEILVLQELDCSRPECFSNFLLFFSFIISVFFSFSLSWQRNNK